MTRFARWLEEVGGCSISSPYIITMGGTDVHVDLVKESSHAYLNKLLLEAKAITVFSDAAKFILEEKFPPFSEKISVIPQGVVLPDIRPRTEVRPWAHIEKIGFNILLPAGLRPVKDVLHLLEAWKMLHETLPKLHVRIIGECLDNDVAITVKNVCNNYSFIEYVEAVDFSRMGAIYKEADLVINSSIEEGQPTAICEAMGLGIPVIARNNAGNRAFVKHGETGFLYINPEQFVKQVLFLFRRPAKANEMIRRAKQFITQKLTLEQEVAAYQRLFDRM